MKDESIQWSIHFFMMSGMCDVLILFALKILWWFLYCNNFVLFISFDLANIEILLS